MIEYLINNYILASIKIDCFFGITEFVPYTIFITLL